jgi:hypothetical protein
MTQPMRRAAWFVSALTALLVGGCDPATYTDQNFDSDLGADFRAPVHDAGDEADTAAGGAAGSGASAGSGGSAGNAATTGSAATGSVPASGS